MQKLGSITVSDEAYHAGHFVCPNCGDTKFGSIQQPDGTLLRACHGNVNDEEACGFRWPDSDDHKYFHLPLSFVLRLVDRV